MVKSLEPGETAPAPKPEDKPKPLSGSAESFNELTTEYRAIIGQGMDRFQARDFTGALVAANKADQMRTPTVWSINLRGAVAIEQKKFDQGAAYCAAALDLDPTFFPARFNLCEVPFLQGKYAEARKMWEGLLTGYPVGANSTFHDGTPELLMYRIFLCHLLEKNIDEAKVWLDKLPFPSDTAAYYYAHAAWERAQGHNAQWVEWVKQAEYIWPASKRSSFTDILIQLGWLKPDQTPVSPDSGQPTK